MKEKEKKIGIGSQSNTIIINMMIITISSFAVATKRNKFIWYCLVFLFNIGLSNRGNNVPAKVFGRTAQFLCDIVSGDFFLTITDMIILLCSSSIKVY